MISQQEDQYGQIFQQLRRERIIRQLRMGKGAIARLGESEAGELMLDWVEGPLHLLAHPQWLQQVEDEAAAILDRNIHHIIWSGMGGSIQCVNVLSTLGFCQTLAPGRVVIHPLESTDPQAMGTIVQQIAQAKGMTLSSRGAPRGTTWTRTLLEDVMMIGVSMGKSSEEPITHLSWFLELLDQALLPASKHTAVMTIAGSVLDHFAGEYRLPRLPLFLNEKTGMVGRMSAPCTRVFLLPVALHMIGRARQHGQLYQIVQRAWELHDLDQAEMDPAGHPFVRLAVALHLASRKGVCRLLLQLPGIWQAMLSWVEQIMEQSLGKGGKGVVVLHDQFLEEQTPASRGEDLLRVHVVVQEDPASCQESMYELVQPYLNNPEPRDGDPAESEPEPLLSSLAASMLGWQVAMVVYAALQEIPYSTEPAVERYKALARDWRERPDELPVDRWPTTFHQGRLMVLAPPQIPGEQNSSHAAIIAATLLEHIRQGALGYVDFTVYGEIPDALYWVISMHLHQLGNRILGVPVKLRQAPAALHINEQSEVDGPSYLVSIRLFVRDHDGPIIGTYSSAFLYAQAVASWQAMIERGRSCFLLIANESHGADRAIGLLFRHIEHRLADQLKGRRE